MTLQHKPIKHRCTPTSIMYAQARIKALEEEVDALNAVLGRSAGEREVAVKVRELVWPELGFEYGYKSSFYRQTTAESICGPYIIRQKRHNPDAPTGYSVKPFETHFELSGATYGYDFETLDDAKAGAQADYNRRVLSAIEIIAK